MPSFRFRLLISFIASLLLGGLLAALSAPAPFLSGWLGASFLSFIAVFSLQAAWKWAGGGKALAWMSGAAFLLRLGLGIILSLGVQAYGYQNEKVQQAGYLYADAFTRDNDAWDLAQSGRPILSAFSQEIISDQYGGWLALGATVYRYLSPDFHRRFLMLILSAFVAALGLPFFWKAVRARWGEKISALASWILVLYPESVFLGGSQLREPYLIGLACIGFFAVFSWRSERKPALVGGLLAMTAMALISWRAAAVVLSLLVVTAWLDGLDDIKNRRVIWAGWGVMALIGLGALALSWNWIELASRFDTYLTMSASGWVQKLVGGLGKEWGVPFMTAYGLVQPVLPAVIVEPAAWIWKVIGLLRAAGWYALAPFLLYAAWAAWGVQIRRDRRLLAGLALAALAWVVVSSLRAGGDMWDNPRYRTLILPWLALLAAWAWAWARERKDLRLWGFIAADIIFTLVFLAWYISRYSGAGGGISFWGMAVGIVLAAALAMAGLWLLDWRRKRRSTGQPANLAGMRTQLVEWLALKPTTDAADAADIGQPAHSRPARRINRWDWIAAVLFLGFALLYFLGRLQGNYPVIILSGDAGNIASYAAALDHPDWFALDPVLGNLNNIGVYATIHIPLIRLLAPLAGGDYALAYLWLLAPHIFVQLLGFYILGRVLFHSRFWAFLLAVLTAGMVIDVGLGEFWGLWRDPLPRFTFQALLPFLLALAVVWRNTPKRWPWLMVFAGLLVYAHPISAPTWGFAVWLGLWLFQPKAWKLTRRLLAMLGLGLLFLAVLTPFALNYLSYQRGAAGDYATLMPIMQAYFPDNLLNVPGALADFLLAMTKNLLLPLALLGLAAAWLLHKTGRPLIRLALVWGAGIAVVTLLVPFAERLVEQQLKILPIETELMRGLRYFLPLLMLFWLWPLAGIEPRLANHSARQAALGLGLLLVGFWSLTHLPDARRLLDAVSCLAKGQVVCSADRSLDYIIEALGDRTQPGEGVFFFNQDERFTSNSLSVRYGALRPLVHSPRDHGILGYADRAALPAWDTLTKEVEALREIKDPLERVQKLIPIATRLKASYLAIDFPLQTLDLAHLPVTVVRQAGQYLLLELEN